MAHCPEGWEAEGLMLIGFEGLKPHAASATVKSRREQTWAALA